MVKDPNTAPPRKRGALPIPKDIMDAAVPFKHAPFSAPDEMPDVFKAPKELDQTGTGVFKMSDTTNNVGGKGTPGTPPPPAGTKVASTQGSSGNVGTPGMPPPPAAAKAKMASDHGSSGNVGKPGMPPPPAGTKAASTQGSSGNMGTPGTPPPPK